MIEENPDEGWMSWARHWRPVQTLWADELGVPEGYVSSGSFQMGVGWYDRPNGTSDHEGTDPWPTTISSESNATEAA